MSFASPLRTCLAAVALGAACLGTATSAIAAYPDRPVRVIVGFAPGGTNDILARLVAVKLQERLKQSFIVENRPGANSIIAAETVAKGPADGYTIFVASSGAMTVNPAVYSKLPYDPLKDFQPVAVLGSFPLVVTVNADSSARKLADLKGLAAKKKDDTLAHGVATSAFQLAAELYSRESGVKFLHVNYKGTGPVTAGLLGGEVDVAFVDIAAVVPQIKGGKLRALAVTTTRRSAVLPDVPTVAESGTPGYDVPIWTGLVLPLHTPPEVAATLTKALRDILATPDVIKQLQALGMEPGHAEGAAFGKEIASDITRWTALAKSADIKAD